jgi:hypothetical protein
MSARRDSTSTLPGRDAATLDRSSHSPRSGPKGQRFPGLARLTAFFCLFVVLAYGFDALITGGLRRVPTSKFGALNRVVDGKVNADIVINGSSRALVHYDPRILERSTGLTAFNLGMNATHIDVQLAVLQTYLKHNRKPRLVIQNLEAFSFITTKKAEIYDPALYLPFLKEPVLYRSLLAIDPAVRKWKYIPLYGYAIEDLRFTWVRALLAWGGIHPREDYIQGFNPRNLQWTEDFERFRSAVGEGMTYEIQPAGVSALRELIAICQTNGIELLLVYSPEYFEAQGLVRNRAEIFAKFRALTAETGATFWDYSDSPLNLIKDMFYNSQHLNAMGAERFSQDLGRRLNDEFRTKLQLPVTNSDRAPMPAEGSPAGRL